MLAITSNENGCVIFNGKTIKTLSKDEVIQEKLTSDSNVTIKDLYEYMSAKYNDIDYRYRYNKTVYETEFNNLQKQLKESRELNLKYSTLNSFKNRLEELDIHIEDEFGLNKILDCLSLMNMLKKINEHEDTKTIWDELLVLIRLKGWYK